MWTLCKTLNNAVEVEARSTEVLTSCVVHLVEYISSLYNCDIEIIDNTEKSEQQELVEDLVQIITVFSCKLQGKRANKARKLVNELIEESGEDNGKNNSSNVNSKQ